MAHGMSRPPRKCSSALSSFRLRTMYQPKKSRVPRT